MELSLSLGDVSSSNKNKRRDFSQKLQEDDDDQIALHLKLFPTRISPWSSDIHHNGSWENEKVSTSGNIGSGKEVVSGENNRKKLRLSKQQSACLEQSFKQNNSLNPKEKVGLAKELNLRPRQIEVWFQNRRARTKLKQTEFESDYLKSYCHTLREENRKLQKELQQLRRNIPHNYNYIYMQQPPPATTLTMCPSCMFVKPS